MVNVARNGHRRIDGLPATDKAARVQALDRGLAILDLVAGNREPMAVSEIASALRVSLPTASRLAATLRERGLLHQEVRGGRYSLGLGLVRYARGALDGHPLETASARVLERLLRELDDTVSLAVPSTGGALYVRSLAPEDRVFRISIPAGKVLPYHVTATGKVLLAFGPSARVEGVIAAGLPRRTRYSIDDPEELRRALAQVRRQGYAVDRGESDANVGCVAVPLRGREALVAALSCSMARTDLTPQRIEYVREALAAGVEEIEEAFTRPR